MAADRVSGNDIGHIGRKKPFSIRHLFDSDTNEPAAIGSLVEQAKRRALPGWIRALPTVNASLNALCALFLIVGWSFIRSRDAVPGCPSRSDAKALASASVLQVPRVRGHIVCMVLAVLTSAIFLGFYLVYHYHAGSMPFRGQGPIRWVYFTVLISHTFLATLGVVPLVLLTLLRALQRDFSRHRLIAATTFPIWVYVSVTGVGNLIGTTADGLHALGNQEDGILLDSATSTTIGGTSAGEGNVISGNLSNGVEALTSSPDNLLAGNEIGTDRSATLALGNRGNGVSLGSSSNLIGGLNSEAGNTIANNGTGSVGAGVQLIGLVNQNTILSNSIHDNAGLGINLGNGPTPNHQPGTPGPNNFQNYPIFTSAQTDGKTTTIAGTLLGAPNSTYTLQVFWSPSPDPSGYGEGQTLICTTIATTDSTGNCVINLSLPAAPPPGAAISASATDDAGNTSEFSPDISIKGVTDLTVSIVASPSPVGVGGTLTYTVAVSNTGTLDAHHVVLTDQLPYLFSATSVLASQGSPPVLSGQTVTASLGTVAAGGTATLTIAGTVMTGAGPSVTDTASVTLDEIDPTPANDSASVTTPVAAVADLSLAMTPSASTVHVGDSLTYTITASNQGPSPATNVQISVPLNAGVSFSSASTTQGSASFASGLLTASPGSLAVGAQATVNVVVQALGVGTFSTTASITSDQAEPTSGDNSATVSVIVQPVVDLAVSIVANPSPVAVGQDLVYAVDVINRGPDEASAVTLANVLPAGVAFISASLDDCVESGARGRAGRDSHGAATAGCQPGCRFIHSRIGACSRPGDGLGRSRCSRIRRSGNRHADHPTASIGPRAADDVGLGPGLQRRYRARAGRGFGHGDRRRRGGPVDRHYAPVRPRTPRAGLDLHADGRQRRPFRRHQRGRDFTSAAGDRACLCVLQPAGTADSAARRYLRSARNHRRRPVGRGHDRRPAVPAGARPRGTAHERGGFGRRF